MNRWYWYLAPALALALAPAAPAQDAASLASPDEAVRKEAVERMERGGAKTVPALAALLWGRDGTAHLNAYQALRGIAWRAGRPGAEKERAEVAAALIAQSRPPAGRSAAARRTLLEVASLVSGPESVPALRALLADREVRDMALFALQRTPGAEAASALIAVLKNGDPTVKARAALALGARAEVTAGPALIALLPSGQAAGAGQAVHLAAIRALGSIPTDAGAEALWRIQSANGPRAVRQAARASYLRMAGAFSRGGKPDAAIAMARNFLSGATTAADRSAGLAVLARLGGPGVPDALLAALGAPDAQVRAQAAVLLGDSEEPGVTEGLVRALKTAEDDAIPGLLAVLGQRPGEAALEALIASAASPHRVTRVEAIRALVARPDVPSERALAVYHPALEKAETDDERRVILPGIARIGDPASLPFLQGALNSPGTRSEALAATLPIADRLAGEGKREEAVTLYREAITRGGSSSVIAVAAGRLRDLGIDIDLTSHLGFVTYWWVLGPLSGRERWTREDAVAPGAVNPDTAVTVGGQALRWRRYQLVNPSGMVDLHQAAGRRSDAAAYLYAEVTSPQAQAAALRLGSDDGAVVWLNGEKVLEVLQDRPWAVDQDRAPVQLAAGVNRILVKVLNGGADWAVSLRIVDANGDPLELEPRKK